MVTPGWVRYVNYLATAILGAGTLLAVLAALGGLTKGDMSALQGAIIVFVLSLTLWKLLRFIASFGPRPVTPAEKV
jgi:hypothetical protein